MAQNTYGRKFLKQMGRKGDIGCAGKPVRRRENSELYGELDAAKIHHRSALLDRKSADCRNGFCGRCDSLNCECKCHPFNN
jgi:hypothetical protein